MSGEDWDIYQTTMNSCNCNSKKVSSRPTKVLEHKSRQTNPSPSRKELILVSLQGSIPG